MILSNGNEEKNHSQSKKIQKFRWNLTIDPSSMDFVDQELAKIRDTVIPIVSMDDRMRPCLLGSAILINYRGVKIIATANHLLTDNIQRPLLTFDASGLTRSIKGVFWSSEEFDIAARRLVPEEIEAFNHVPFLDQDLLGVLSPPSTQFYACVVGYPATAAKVMGVDVLDTVMEIYSNSGTMSGTGKVIVHFDKKQGAMGANGHTLARDPTGKSGGAIFGFLLTGLTVQNDQSPKLLGLATTWRRRLNQIEGTDILHLRLLLDVVAA